MIVLKGCLPVPFFLSFHPQQTQQQTWYSSQMFSSNGLDTIASLNQQYQSQFLFCSITLFLSVWHYSIILIVVLRGWSWSAHGYQKRKQSPMNYCIHGARSLRKTPMETRSQWQKRPIPRLLLCRQSPGLSPCRRPASRRADSNVAYSTHSYSFIVEEFSSPAINCCTSLPRILQCNSLRKEH